MEIINNNEEKGDGGFSSFRDPYMKKAPVEGALGILKYRIFNLDYF